MQQAGLRELWEETNINIFKYSNLMKFVGKFEGGGRDPRDNKEAWVATHAFFVPLPNDAQVENAKPKDDAKELQWFPIERVLSGQVQLAFDHFEIIKKAFEKYG
jgi:8-oxo-dGTP diphosphatase